MSGRRLDVNLVVEAGARQLREAGCIVWIGLVGLHRFQALMFGRSMIFGIPLARNACFTGSWL